MALILLGALRVNLWLSLVLALGRSLLQLTVLAVGVSIALEFPRWGTIGLGLFLGIIATQFTYTRLELPLDRYRVGGILVLAALIPTLYAIIVVLRPTPLLVPQIWIPLFSLSLASASTIVLQGGNGLWQEFQRQQVSLQGTGLQRSDHLPQDALEEDPLEDPLPEAHSETQNSKLKTQNPLPEPPSETQNSKLKTQNPLPEIYSKTQNPLPETPSETQNPKLKTQNPLPEAHSETQNSKLKTQNSLNSLWQEVLTRTLRFRCQQLATLGLMGLPLVFAAQLLVNIDPVIALGYEVLLMLTSLNSGLIALWGLHQIRPEICRGLAKTNTMRRGIPRV